MQSETPISQLRLYRGWLAEERGLVFDDWSALWRWSTVDLEAFWASIWDYHHLESPTPYASVIDDEPMPHARWFHGAQVNYARQVFRHVADAERAGLPAIVAEDELDQRRTLSWQELRRQSASLALELRRLGVKRGDRVAAYMPNVPEAVVGLLACASLGAIWTLCSTDMSAPAVIDRFQQTAPKALLAVDGVYYAGRPMDRSAAVAEVRSALPSLAALLLLRTGFADSDIPDAVDLRTALSTDNADVASFEPEWLPFDHPLWILYSSGTTGLPKAIVHGHGGIIVSTCAGHLHFDLGPSYAQNTWGERFHWYSATGWVMWNVQVGALLAGTTICMFDGAPGGARERPDWGALWRFAARNRVSWFGASAAFFSSCRKSGLDFGSLGDIGAIRALGSTGSPLAPDVQLWGTEQFAALGRPDIWWCNVSGGTEIAAAFLSGNRELPATPGRLQCRHLGAAVAAWSPSGQSLLGRVGELVCTRPFPSMPRYFWGDEDGSRYRSSYFSEWSGVWRHGDWLRIDSDGSCTITGRSDATINRHGLRLGTAEIYAAVEPLDEIADSLVVDVEDGQGDSSLIIFVVPADDGSSLETIQATVASAIRRKLSPRFIPDRLVLAPGVPRTLSGKKQEIPIKRLLQGWPVAEVINLDSTANPEVIPWYIAYAEQWSELVK